MLEKKELSKETVENFSKKFRENTQNKIVMNSVMKNGINASSTNNDSIVNMQYTFSEEIDTGKVTNQKQSGRCWLFAGLNAIRHKMNNNLNLSKDYELSQNYQMFWDKFEKANYFLTSIIETADEDVNGRLVMWLLSSPQQDGGQWDMFANIVRKYGVVPKYVMPETFQSSRTGDMNSLLNVKLRQDAVTLRKLYKNKASEEKLYENKEKMLGEIYSMLCCFLGEPPKKFDFEFRDEKKEFHRDSNITPLEFYKKYADFNLDDYISIINAPTEDKPFNKTYTVKYLGNIIGGNDVLYLNLDIETFKSLAIAQIKDNETVWFGCDVGKYLDRDLGIMDTNLYNYEETLGISLEMTKANRLDYMGSCLTHAMVITGVNIADGVPNRWKIENSWGDEKGNKGFHVMSDSWFDEFTYQIVINKKYLSLQLMEALKQEPIKLHPWDPMGALAIMK